LVQVEPQELVHRDIVEGNHAKNEKRWRETNKATTTLKSE
jgi:hypothetical protein